MALMSGLLFAPSTNSTSQRKVQKKDNIDAFLKKKIHKIKHGIIQCEFEQAVNHLT